ncbi:hypothetical protein [Fulvivirga imtechensis]|uniref:hypothetical protein n=1 Tax=Fulvivirga imtechensis TaxID=881893 RepID=UPI0012FB693A|nr:hypothetical protein [Fulvivirga imtechensis]
MHIRDSRSVLPSSDVLATIRHVAIRSGLHTGVPDAGAPLYTLKGRKAALPISLRYHTQTPHHNLYSSWAGEGWSLEAGGMIARVIKSSDDFSAHGYIGSNLPTTIQGAGVAGLNNYLTQGYDTQPDQFYYSFAGHSGKFLFRPDGSIINSGFDRLDISLPSNELDIWEVKDHSGIIYRFGGTGFVEQAGNSQTDKIAVTAWFIREIVYPNGEMISFEYHTPFKIPVVKNAGKTEYYASGIPSLLETESAVSHYYTPYLKKITLNSGLSAFSAQFEIASDRQDGSSRKRLKSVRIFRHHDVSHTGELLKIFTLHHEKGPLLWLEKISEHRETVGNAYAETKFTYYDRDNINRAYGSTDYWGYYNGGTATGDFPKVTYNHHLEDELTTSGVVKKPSSTPAGLLKEMAYSLGKKVVYTYEPHQFEETLTDEHGVGYSYGGGYRIKTIESHDGTGPVITTTYAYTQPGGSTSGKLQAPPVTRYTGQRWHNINSQWTLKNTSVRTNFINNYLGLAPAVTYGVVKTEVAGRGMNSFAFYNDKASTATVTSEGYNNSSSGPITTHLDFLYGKLKSQEQYAKENNTYRLISGTSYDYEVFEESGVPLLQLTSDLVNGGTGGVEAAIRELYLNGGTGSVAGHEDKVCGLTYKQVPFRKARLLEVENTAYGDEGNSQSSSANYSYTAQNYPRQVVQNLPGNVHFEQAYSYAEDYPGVGFCDELTVRNMKSVVVESHTTRTDNAGSTITNGQAVEFSANTNAINGETQMVPVAIYHLERVPDGGVAESEIPTVSSLNYKKKASLAYDGYGNVVTTTHNDEKYAAVWDEDKLLPVAQAVRADASEVYYNGFEECCYDEAKAGLYSHQGGSFTIPFTPPSGKSYEMSYWYLENGEWLLYTGPFTSAINKGEALDEIKVYPSGSIMTTASFNSKSQAISQSDVNDIFTYNEYDESGSLVRVRDKDENILQQFSYHNHYLPPCEDPSGDYPITASFQVQSNALKVIAAGGCGKLRYNWYYIDAQNRQYPLNNSSSSISTGNLYACEEYFTLKCTVTDERALNSKTIYHHINTDTYLSPLQMDEFDIFYGEQSMYCPGDVIKVIGTARNGCGSYDVKWQFRKHETSQFTTISTGEFIITYTFQEAGTLRCTITDAMGDAVSQEVFLKGKRTVDCEEF